MLPGVQDERQPDPARDWRQQWRAELVRLLQGQVSEGDLPAKNPAERSVRHPLGDTFRAEAALRARIATVRAHDDVVSDYDEYDHLDRAALLHRGADFLHEFRLPNDLPGPVGLHVERGCECLHRDCKRVRDVLDAVDLRRAERLRLDLPLSVEKQR